MNTSKKFFFSAFQRFLAASLGIFTLPVKPRVEKFLLSTVVVFLVGFIGQLRNIKIRQMRLAEVFSVVLTCCELSSVLHSVLLLTFNCVNLTPYSVYLFFTFI